LRAWRELEVVIVSSAWARSAGGGCRWSTWGAFTKKRALGYASASATGTPGGGLAASRTV